MNVSSLLSNAVTEFMICKYCHNVKFIHVAEKVKNRKGLASTLVFICEKCGKEHSFSTLK